MGWKHYFSCLLFVSCLAVAGCMGSERPEISPVQGKVTYKGKPVTGANVVFLCPGAPRMAVGVTDEEGEYTLTTYEQNDGAMIGTHTITVRKLGADAGSDPSAAVSPMDPESMTKAIQDSMRQSAQEAKAAEKSNFGLPMKYAQLKTSDLHKEVAPGANVINLDLTD